ncbi:hypothetical protein [Brevibacterium samyangense]|uniref:Helix-turn-helix domain-containing protein n=1 Tax=Brevibacterium samyangense TaxID=366888 RepID=A0ABP5F0E5_9MICO
MQTEAPIMMNSATFRATREFLGLSDSWLADHLGVSPRTVRKWGTGESPVPVSVAEELTVLADRTARVVERYAEHFREREDRWPMTIPRTLDQGHQWHHDPGMPVDWWRNLAARVCERVPGLWLEWPEAA